MASKPLEFHLQAEQEYLSALAWYQERSPTAALNFESAFDRAIRTISEAPHRWPIYLAGSRSMPSINFRSLLSTRFCLLTLSFWRSPMAIAAQATGEIEYDMRQVKAVRDVRPLLGAVTKVPK